MPQLSPTAANLEGRIVGGLLGIAAGDAVGATVEFMARKDIVRLYGRHVSITGGGKLR